jgi:plasmid stability protein
MSAITIRNVPDDIAAALKVRAAQAGQSLQAYLLDLMRRDAGTLTITDAVARMEEIAVTEGPVSEVLDALDQVRAGR